MKSDKAKISLLFFSGHYYHVFYTSYLLPYNNITTNLAAFKNIHCLIMSVGQDEAGLLG